MGRVQLGGSEKRALILWVLAGMVFIGGLLSVLLDARLGAQAARRVRTTGAKPSDAEAGRYEPELESLLPSNIPK